MFREAKKGMILRVKCVKNEVKFNLNLLHCCWDSLQIKETNNVIDAKLPIFLPFIVKNVKYCGHFEKVKSLLIGSVLKTL